jgi:integrase
MGQRAREQLGFSKTVGVALGRPDRLNRGLPGRPRLLPDTAMRTGSAPPPALTAGDRTDEPAVAPRGPHRLEPLVREWLLDLQVAGRSPKTIRWYEQKIRWYLQSGDVEPLEQLNGFELKRYLAERQRQGLADNSIHGDFETMKAFCNWALRDGYPVDPSILRVRAPKVAEKEPETYSAAQLDLVLRAAAAGWARLAILILLGTGMRVSELWALTLEDVEDDGDATFLKVRRGKGAKFRRVPVSRQLRRELLRYLNRQRPETAAPNLLVLRDGRPVRVETVTDLFRRTQSRLSFKSTPIGSATRSRRSTCAAAARSSGCVASSATRAT